MGAMLDRLWSVQQLQTELIEVGRQRDAELGRMQERLRRCEELRRTVNARREELTRKQGDARAAELEIKTLDEARTAMRNKLNACRNDREYKAMLTEIAGSEQQGEALLERSTRLDADIKTASSTLADLDSQLSAAEVARKFADGNSQAIVDELNRKLSDLQQRRAQLMVGTPLEAARQFEKLSVRFEGQAMAAIEPVDDEGEFSCSSCNMGLTSGVVSAVMNNDAIRCCPTCSRILYFGS